MVIGLSVSVLTARKTTLPGRSVRRIGLSAPASARSRSARGAKPSRRCGARGSSRPSVRGTRGGVKQPLRYAQSDDSLRDRLDRAHAVRQARRRPRRAPGDAARLDRDPRRAGARGHRAGRGRVRDHGPGAAGWRRPGSGASGRDRRRAAEGDARGHHQQGLRVVDPSGRDRRPDDPRRRPRGGRHRRHGVHVERALPAPQGPLRLPHGPRRADRLDDLRRAHRRVRPAAHDPAQLDGLARARDLPGGAGRVGVSLAPTRGGAHRTPAASGTRSSPSATWPRTRGSGATRHSSPSRS